jgi:antitoxin component HigA of HigAB toxin-antitoxin module
MKNELNPICTKTDYEEALAEVERLWGAKSGTREGNRLDVLATLIDAYEAEHYPIDPPDPVEAIKFRMEQQRLAGGNMSLVEVLAQPDVADFEFKPPRIGRVAKPQS